MRRICWSRNVFSECLKTTIDVIAGYAREVSSRREDRRNRTHVDNSLTCCGEENSKILGWQNVVDGFRQHPQPELYWFYVLTPYVSLGQWRRQGERGRKASPLWVNVRKLCNMCVLPLSWNFFVSHENILQDRRAKSHVDTQTIQPGLGDFVL